MNLQKKLMAAFIAVSIPAVAIMGVYSSNVALKSTRERLNEVSYAATIQTGKTLDSKIERINKYLDVLSTNIQIQTSFRKTDFVALTGDTVNTINALDAFMASFFENEPDVECAAFFKYDGGRYVYNGYIPDDFDAESQKWYERISGANGNLLWTGREVNPNRISEQEDCIMVGRILKDTAYQKDLKPLGMLVLLLNSERFLNVFDTQVQDGNNRYLFSDRMGTPLLINGKGVREYSFAEAVIGGNSGYFNTKIEQKQWLVTYYTSPQTGWKTVGMELEDDYTRKIGSIMITTVLLCLLCLAVILLLSTVLARRITQPVLRLKDSMGQMQEKNFDVRLPVTTEDEIGVLTEDFNEMAQNMKELFAKVVKEENEKRRAQIMALQYQINPHFLYNTLASIGFTASMQQADQIAQMLRVLSRLLRSAIASADRLIPFSQELCNIKDYVFLQQIRYNNQLTVCYQLEEAFMEARVPGMLLQPVVENAISHGLNKKLNRKEEAIVTISLTCEENTLLILVEDNGIGMEPEQIRDIFLQSEKENQTHVGILNIHQRIRLYFGEKYGLSIASEPGQFTRVTVRLPLLWEGEI